MLRGGGEQVTIAREGMTQAKQSYIASGTEPIAEKTVLPKGRELKWFKKELGRALGSLRFYALEDTYFAIAFLPDPPCGELMKDFSETENLGFKPGKRARDCITKFNNRYAAITPKDARESAPGKDDHD